MIVRVSARKRRFLEAKRFDSCVEVSVELTDKVLSSLFRRRDPNARLLDTRSPRLLVRQATYESVSFYWITPETGRAVLLGNWRGNWHHGQDATITIDEARRRADEKTAFWNEYGVAPASHLRRRNRRELLWEALPPLEANDRDRLDRELNRFMGVVGPMFKSDRQAKQALLRKLLLRGLAELEKEHAQRQDDSVRQALAGSPEAPGRSRLRGVRARA